MLSSESSSLNKMDQNSFPEFSNDSKQLIPSDIIKDRLRHFISGEINEDICQILIRECSFKLTGIIKAGTNYMKSCNRYKFTTEDFNKGLVCYGFNPIMEYNLPKQKKRSRQKPTENTFCETLVDTEELWLNNKSPLSASIQDLPDELQNYFNAAEEALLVNDDKITSIILKDIQTNRNIFQLVPHFVNFFCDAIKKYQTDFLKVSNLLRFLSSLMRNPHCYFGQDCYLNSLVCSLLKFLAADIPHTNQGKDCWLLKDNAAHILANIIKMTKDHHLFFEVIYFVESVLSFENSLNSHYGALVTLNSIGVLAIILLLPKYNHEFKGRTKTSRCSNSKNEIDYHMVKGQIIQSHFLLANYFLKNEIKKPVFCLNHLSDSVNFFPEYLKDINIFQILSQLSFSEYFGESMLPFFPLLNFSSCSFLRKKQKSNQI